MSRSLPGIHLGAGLAEPPTGTKTRKNPDESRESRDKRQVSYGGSASNSRKLNDVSAEDLERVSQIDGERARYLVEARKRIGGFKSWDDLKRETVRFEDRMVERLQQAGFTLDS